MEHMKNLKNVTAELNNGTEVESVTSLDVNQKERIDYIVPETEQIRITAEGIYRNMIDRAETQNYQVNENKLRLGSEGQAVFLHFMKHCGKEVFMSSINHDIYTFEDQDYYVKMKLDGKYIPINIRTRLNWGGVWIGPNEQKNLQEKNVYYILIHKREELGDWVYEIKGYVNLKQLSALKSEGKLVRRKDVDKPVVKLVADSEHMLPIQNLLDSIE